MRKKSIFIFITFILCIGLLSADSFHLEDIFTELSIPFANKELHHTKRSSSDPLMDTLLRFADTLGQRMNGTLIIAKNDTILVEKAYGYLQLYKNNRGYEGLAMEQLDSVRNLKNNRMTTETIFDLASVSKQFTAAAILKLCYEEKMSLQDSLGKYFPNMPYHTVTVREMLNHTSGIPEYFNFNYALYDTSTFISTSQLCRVMRNNKFDRIFKPSGGFAYTNTNYVLLAKIVEIVAEQPFEQYVRDNLWKPAGMKHTYFFTELVGLYPEDAPRPHASVRKGQELVDIQPLRDNFPVPIARGHFKGGSLAKYDRLNAILGDKGVYSNVEDMLRWTHTFYIECKILPKEWVEMACESQNILPSGIIPKKLYGYGVHLENNKEHGWLVYHGGLWNGFHNLWLYRPSDGTICIFLSNFYNASHVGKSNELLNIIDQYQNVTSAN